MMEDIVLAPKKSNLKRNLIITLCTVFMVVVLLLTYLPLFVMAMVSFSNDKFGMDMVGFTFKWYAKIFEPGPLRESIIYTLEITFCSTIISTVLGTFSAIGINALSKKNRKRFIILNNVPILNADIVTGVFLLIIFQVVSIILGMSVFGFVTTLIAHVLFSTPYVVLSVLPKLSQNDSNLYDAAIDLGCPPFVALCKVVIPSIKSGIFSGMLLAFTMSIDDFIISYFVTGEQDNFSTWLYGSLKTLKNGQWNQACAYNTLIMIATITCVILYQVINSKKKRKI